MPQIFLFLLSILFSTSIHAQLITINGTVIDKESGEPLPYAHIIIKGKSIGTLSQVNGTFSFHFRSSGRDTLEISYIGYRTSQSLVQDLNTSVPLQFELSPQTIQLRAVTIRESSIKAADVIAQAIAQLTANYASNPHLLQGFFRDWKMVDFNSSQKDQSLLVEAAVNIHVKYTKKRLGNDVYLKALRRNELPERGWNYFNSLQDLLNRNYVTNPASADFYDLEAVLKFPNSYSFRFNNDLSDERYLCVEAVSRDGKMMYTLFLDERSYSIVRIDLKNTSVFERGDWNILKVDNTYRYRELNGKWYLSYCRRNWRIENVQRVTNTLNRTEEYYIELLVNDIQPEPGKLQLDSLGTRMINNRPLEFQTTTNDSSFWDTYNVIENDSLMAKVNAFIRIER